MARDIFRDGNVTHLYEDEPEHSAQRKEQIALAVRSVVAEEDATKLQVFYKAALRILAIQQKWQKEHPSEPFKRRFLIGSTKKKVVEISFASGLWFTSPTNYAVALEDVLRRTPTKTPNSIEW